MDLGEWLDSDDYRRPYAGQQSWVPAVLHGAPAVVIAVDPAARAAEEAAKIARQVAGAAAIKAECAAMHEAAVQRYLVLARAGGKPHRSVRADVLRRLAEEDAADAVASKAARHAASSIPANNALAGLAGLLARR